MNLDLLIKLVKLANNNPNDNEANLAARKVCKMIAEGNYQFGQIPSVKPKVTVASTSSYYDWVNEFIKKQSKQQGWYQTQWNEEEVTKKNPKRRICTKCGLNVDTYNKREPFICFACIYGEHNRRTP